MKQRSLLTVTVAILLFLGGVLLEVSISGTVAWGEMEARTYVSQNAASGLNLKCPLVLSPGAHGMVSAVISNTQDSDSLPVVTADFSHASGEQFKSQTLFLPAHASQIVQWEVEATDPLYGRLILVNLTQARYQDLPPHQEACGILILSFLGLGGIQVFSLLFLISILCVGIGAGIWLRERSPLDDIGRNLAQASGILAGVTTAALLSALARLWGLILFLDALALILIVVIFTELILFPRPLRN